MSLTTGHVADRNVTLWRLVRHGGILVLALTLLLTVQPSRADVRYVDDDASLRGDGVSWETAYTYLQDAISDAIGNPDVTEIRIAGGTYTPDLTENGKGVPGEQFVSFDLVNAVAILGGFRGPALPGDPDDRDIALFVTTLSGDLNGDDLPGFVNYGDNSNNVVFSLLNDPSAILDGVTISGGNAGGKEALGGGLYAPSVGFVGGGSSPTIIDCTIEANFGSFSGGGMYFDGGSPTLTRCSFVGNETFVAGGGLAASGGALTLVDCEFESNVSQKGDGGGIAMSIGSLSISGGRFESNLASCNGGAISVSGLLSMTVDDVLFLGNEGFCDGGALVVRDTNGSIANCRFEDNFAKGSGGAVSNDGTAGPSYTDCIFFGNSATLGGATSESSDGTPRYTNCSFQLNSAGAGGAMRIANGSPRVTDCLFLGNDGFPGGAVNQSSGDAVFISCVFRANESNSGGAYRLADGSADFVNSTFDANAAADSGGAVALLTATPSSFVNCIFTANQADRGGAVANLAGDPELFNCTFNANSAVFEGGALYNVEDGTAPVISNCILWGDTAPFGPEAWTTDGSVFPSFAWCDVQGSGGSAKWDANIGVDKGGNIDADPLFVSPLSEFGPDLRLGADSPAINAGDNELVPADQFDLDGNEDTEEPIPFDHDGNPRILFGVVDMGALESLGTVGACCGPDETCVVTSPGNCEESGGEYQGDFTTCEEVECTLLPWVVFEPPQKFLAEGEGIIEAVGDFNLDGKQDLVIVIPFDAPATGFVQVFMNLGNDVFGEWQGFLVNPAVRVGVNPTGVAVGLLDGDAFPDVAVSNGGDDTVSILINDGSGAGTFEPPVSLSVPSFSMPSAIAAASVTEDALVDLLVANFGTNTVTVLENLGGPAPGGGFNERQVQGVGEDPVALCPEDVDNDKDIDMLIAQSGNDRVGGAVNGTIAPGGDIYRGFFGLPVGATPVDLATGDLDGNGFIDVVAANKDDGTLSVILNDGDLTFDLSLPPLEVGVMPRSVAIGDLDDDGDLDVVTVAMDDRIGPAVQALENKLDEGKGLVFGPPIAYDVDADPNDAVIVDVNGDGIPNIVTVNADDSGGTGGSVTALLSTTCPGDFDGSGGTGFNDLLAVLSAWGPCDGCPEDLDNDGIVGMIDLMIILSTWGPCE